MYDCNRKWMWTVLRKGRLTLTLIIIRHNSTIVISFIMTFMKRKRRTKVITNRWTIYIYRIRLIITLIQIVSRIYKK